MAGLLPGAVCGLQRQAAVARHWVRRPRGYGAGAGGAKGVAACRTVLELWHRLGEGEAVTPQEAEHVLLLQRQHGRHPHAPLFPWYQALVREHRATALAMHPDVLVELLVRAGRVHLAGNLLASRTLQASMLKVSEATLNTVAVLAKRQKLPAKVLPRFARQVYFLCQRSGLLWTASAPFLKLLLEVLAHPTLRSATHQLLETALHDAAARQRRPALQGPPLASAAAAAGSFFTARPAAPEVPVCFGLPKARPPQPRAGKAKSVFKYPPARRHYCSAAVRSPAYDAMERVPLPDSAWRDTGIDDTQWSTPEDAMALETEGTSTATLASVLIRDLPRDVNRAARLRKLAARYTKEVRLVRCFDRPDLNFHQQPDYAIVRLASGADALAFIQGVCGTNPFHATRPLKVAFLRARKMRTQGHMKRPKKAVQIDREAFMHWEPI
eukprot:TRINITY_DN2994_c0_g1_i1.p2 TRINITY_DN2994_c0_g1~~TRINITY_DN2994_c0_g1_i1.p2  ORF type:complete len:440 (+),score=106.91 TRINITY_DN2994_c0_g1_i1:88-1407(+)